MDGYVAALDRAHRHTLDWLASLRDRAVRARTGIDEVVEAWGRPCRSRARPRPTSSTC